MKPTSCISNRAHLRYTLQQISTKALATLLLSVGLHFAILAQGVPHVEATRLWTTGQGLVVELENEGFESGLGNFTNSGGVNWTTTSSQSQEGIKSATSTVVYGGQDAILNLDVVVPSGYTATVEFYMLADTTQGPDMTDDVRISFAINGMLQSNAIIDTTWTLRRYFIIEGSHLLTWKVTHNSPGSDDEVQAYLDHVVISYNRKPALRMADGSEGFGKILMSDANGNASWKTLSEISMFDNAGGNMLLPIVLDGRHQVQNPLKVIDGNGVGVQSTSNGGNGFSAANNGSDGYKATGNGSDGFDANANNENGFRAFTNSSNGFLSLSNTMDGFRAEDNSRYGFSADSNQNTGFSAVGNDGNGYYASGNSAYGFSASGNGFGGFYSYDHADNGYIAYNNSDNGFSAASNTSDGFYASGNGGDGFDANNNTLVGLRSNNNGTYGIDVSSSTYSGLYTHSNDGSGVDSYFNSSYGVKAHGNDLDGIYCSSNSGDAGYFSGDVTVTGNLSKGGGSFKIDHPLDPANKFLYHSFVESPDMMNVYNGNVILDENGEAVVYMEAWFQPLNRDFRYQLTPIGAPAPNLYIAEEVHDNQFRIAGGTPGLKVSWQLTGIRQDPYANLYRIQVETEKPAEFKGYYLHPEAYGRAFEVGFDYVKLGYKTLEELQAEKNNKY